MTDDAALRHAYRELIAARAPNDRSDCPAPEALLAGVERTGDEAERLAVLDHGVRRAASRRGFDLGGAAAGAGEPAAAGVAPTLHVVRGGGSSARRFPLRSLAVAAGLVVAVRI